MTYLYRLIYNYFERKYILQSSKAPLNILLLLLFLLYLILGNMIRYGWCWLLQDFYLFKLNFNSSVKILMTFCRLRGGGREGGEGGSVGDRLSSQRVWLKVLKQLHVNSGCTTITHLHHASHKHTHTHNSHTLTQWRRCLSFHCWANLSASVFATAPPVMTAPPPSWALIPVRCSCLWQLHI